MIGAFMSFSIPDYIEELRTIVDIDSGTYTLEGIEAVATCMEKKYTDMGWHTQRIDCGIAGKGVEARNKPDAKHIDILFIGHMDTVFPVGTVATRPLTTDAKRAYGPGAGDMKGGLLSIVYALRTLDKAVLDKLSICVCMNPDEETGSLYSAEWLTSVARKAKKVLITEPGRADGSFVNARKGIAVYQLECHGKSVHAGNEPENGRSAITEMANWILAVNKLTNFNTGLTFNVGVVTGGSVSNVVPDYAKALIDTRYWDNDEYEKADAKLKTMTKTAFVDGVSATIKRTAYKPSMVPNKETEVFMALVEECGKELKLPIAWKAVGGASDGNLTAKLGIPSLDAFGPVSGNIHSDAEYFELNSIEPRIQLLQKILEKIAS